MKKYLLFDHDGVLVDTEYWYYQAGSRALATVGITVDLEQYLQDMARGLGSWRPAKEAGLDESTLTRLRKVRDGYYQEYLRTENIEIDGVLEVLEELAKIATMAIVTTSKRADFDLIHEPRAITKHFEIVLTREDYAQSKPHPEPYLTALNRLGASPEEALVIEDSGRGLASALAAGIDCAVVHNDFTKTNDFTGATYRMLRLAELVEVIGTG